ncbi:hypothetical protein EJ03DRAFT_54061 [Teratosphaeria nubilosa]|uniref:Uncharacterized protein n=1 Tax=Teratosphaeria nubilosa TaxID=161662 RepID=A0A6G1KTP9_9PEZI|nr:hypothetical protein EJ03DRAFT_54061 [Teratosphaeria nubilosa]
MDTEVPEIREGMSVRHIRLLTTCANNVMTHLQTVRDAHEKQRAINMNMCMADFINPKDRFRRKAHLRGDSERLTPSRERRGGSPKHRVESPAAVEPDGETSDPRQLDDKVIDAADHARQLFEAIDAADNTRQPCQPADAGNHSSQLSQSLNASGDACNYPQTSEQHNRGRGRNRPATRLGDGASHASSCSPAKEATDADHQRAFDRAVQLMRQSLDVSMGGGVVLMDASGSVTAEEKASDLEPRVTSLQQDKGGARREFLQRRSRTPSSTSTDDATQLGFTHLVSASTPGVPCTSSTRILQERVVVAAASIIEPDRPPITYGRADSTYKVTISPPQLVRMCRKYPRGTLFHIPDHTPASFFDAEGRPLTGLMSAKLWYLILLHRQFPAAKQVIFVPMYHSNLNRWTACFAYTSSPYRTFTYEAEYLHVLSFCNAIRAEVIKIATLFADKQKSEFIGSVSHELRSPLHGILAAIEFLQETECSTFQKSCIDTADACAHTLLDTISMVLDYSKVKSYEAPDQDPGSPDTTTEVETQRRRHKLPDNVLPRTATDAQLNTSSECDIAKITEEVVDGLATGHLTRVRTNIGFDDAGDEHNPSLVSLATRPGLRRVLAATRPEVELVLDVQAMSDWVYHTQPGAFRRIVMNIFGNALKYTKHGYISVSLKVVTGPSTTPRSGAEQSASRTEPVHLVKLIVQDTGKGMSPEYLCTKIFTPFSQENAKAAGTGLGLSIVKALVTMLQGDIDIKSILNMGTIISITFPMKKASQDLSDGLVFQPGFKDPTVLALQRMPHRPQAAIYEPALEDDSFGQSQGVMVVHKALVQYMVGWYHMPTLQTWDFKAPAQILIVDEVHLPAVIAHRPNFLDSLQKQSIIILCANASRQAVLSQDIQSGQVELLCKPFGPYKLARTIYRALEKAAQSNTRVEIIDCPTVEPATPPSSVSTTLVTQRGNSFSEAKESLQYSPEHAAVGETAGGLPLKPKSTRQSSASVARKLALPQRLCKDVRPGPDGGFPFPPGPSLEISNDNDTGHDLTTVIPSVSLSPAKSAGESGLPYLAPSPKLQQLYPSSSDCRSSRQLTRALTDNDRYNDCHTNDDKPPGALPTSAHGAQSIAEAPPAPQARMPKLLLVDDNKVNLNLLHMSAKKKEFGPNLVLLAENGQEAVEQYTQSLQAEFPPDIIFMDISMPIMDGYEATRRIRHMEENRMKDGIPCRRALVVALTGNAGGQNQSEAFKSGVDVYMTKPMSMKEVAKLLDNWRE